MVDELSPGEWGGDNSYFTNLSDAVELPDDFADQMVPLYWRVIVCPVRPKEKTAGGILLPQQVQDTQKYLQHCGRLVAVGEAAFKAKKLGNYAPPEVVPRIGDWVVYGRAAGQGMLYRGVRLLLLNDDEILTIIRDPETLRVFA